MHFLTCYDVVQQCRWHAEDANQQVADCEVENEQIGDRAHVFAAHHDETHHTISNHAHQENKEVGDGEDCSHRRLVEVKVHVGDVLLVRRVFLQNEQIGRVRADSGGVDSSIHGYSLDG